MIHENLVYLFGLSIRSDEGLTLETSASQSLCGGQFTLSTPLINQIFVYGCERFGFPGNSSLISILLVILSSKSI